MSGFVHAKPQLVPMNLAPPTSHHMVIDLGSNVVWVQCQPQIHSASEWASTAARTTGSLARYETIVEDIAAVNPTVVNLVLEVREAGRFSRRLSPRSVPRVVGGAMH
jgi:hypothetical protein